MGAKKNGEFHEVSMQERAITQASNYQKLLIHFNCEIRN
ncbi:hypothetical protein M900_0369 [Bacteriovorax sp. Seq25_V]|nr:hypothetical protein M900_0369 [Bacteriovorax sp. Seq25_V]